MLNSNKDLLSVNVHLLVLIRPKEVKVCRGQRRESYRSLQSQAKNPN
jgi:hypothetical protein